MNDNGFGLHEGSLFQLLGTTDGAVTAATVSIVALSFYVFLKLSGFPIFGLFGVLKAKVLNSIAKYVGKKEYNYRRDLEIGKLNSKRLKVKVYSFLNDLTVDLGLKKRGATPYEFLTIMMILTLFATVALCEMLFGSVILVGLMYPIVFSFIMCVIYTRANIAHDTRIDAVIEAENILCANINQGVVVAVRSSIDTLPKSVREVFLDFLDNIELKNWHIETALLELNAQLGAIADDFIKKCIDFELSEQPGLVGIFKSVVEVNNMKMAKRLEMRRRFEYCTMQFIIGASMIVFFLVGVLVIYPDIRHLYFDTIIGQLIISIDILLITSNFVYMTYLRAQEI